MSLRYQVVKPTGRCPFFQINDVEDLTEPVAYFHERMCPDAEGEAAGFARKLNDSVIEKP